jgi:hypothetical protein
MTQHIEYCHSCGSAISEPSTFCANCGARLAESEPVGTGSAIANSASTGAPAPHQEASSATTTGTQGNPAQSTKTPPRGAPSVTARPQGATTPGAGAGAGGTVSPDAAILGAATAGSTPPGTTAPGTPHPGATPPGTPPTGIAPAGTTPPGTPPGGPWAAATAPSGDQPPKGRRNWIPIAAIGGGALVALGLVVVLLITLGGSAGKDVKSASATREQALQLLAANGTTTVSRAAPGLFALVSAGRLTAAVPAGWRATAQTAASATRAEFADPAHPTSTLTIVAQKGNGNNGHRQALAARRAVRAKGNAIGSFGHVSFPGGREAWRLTYTAGGSTHATYFFPACNTHVAMVVDVSAAGSAFQHEQASLEVLAASAEPKC